MKNNLNPEPTDNPSFEAVIAREVSQIITDCLKEYPRLDESPLLIHDLTKRIAEVTCRVVTENEGKRWSVKHTTLHFQTLAHVFAFLANELEARDVPDALKQAIEMLKQAGVSVVIKKTDQ